MPAGTRIGHVHLYVGDLAAAAAGRLTQAGSPVTFEPGGDVLTHDPWGTGLRVRPAAP